MEHYLIYAVILLGVWAFARLIKVFELTGQLKGNDRERVTHNDNRVNASLMIIFMVAFYAFIYWQIKHYSSLLLPEAASKHGVEIDKLWDFNIYIISLVFILTNTILFIFAWKYYYRKGNKATFFAHSTKLEMIWTIIPAIVLAVIISYGLKTWNAITTDVDPKETVLIELYAKQFDWTARYAGNDNVLGSTNYKLIADGNELALDASDAANMDDKLVKSEFHLPVNKEVLFKFRSRDIIHSAYMPHFRAQMNCVPGMETQFHFIPTITTEEMRKKTNNPEFDYVLLCNKICGAGHYNMQMKIVVESEADYTKWLAEQKTFAETRNTSAATQTAEPIAAPSADTAKIVPAADTAKTATLTKATK
jgi:cytochrome c oxidase subunit 2